MSALSTPPSAEGLGQLMTQLAGLLESSSTAEEFFPHYLEQVVSAAGAAGAAVWQRSPAGPFELVDQVNLAVLTLDEVDNGVACHELLLEDASLRGRTLWVPPREAVALSPNPGAEGRVREEGKANLSPLALLLAPIQVEGKVVGLLEVFLDPELDRQVRRTLARLVTELAGFAAAFFHKTQWKMLQEQQQIWQKVEAFAVELHKSLDPQHIAYLVANDGRRLLECDQVSVGLRLGRACQVAAISGVLSVDKRSPAVKAGSRLCEAVGAWGEPLVYRGGRDESLPADVARALDDYLAQSNSTLLIAAPLTDERIVHGNKVCAVVIAECFAAPGSALPLQQRLEHLTPHVAPAIYNALSVERQPLKWLTRFLTVFRDSFAEQGQCKAAIWLMAVVLTAALLIFVQLPLRTAATGQLVPQDRRIVYAPLNGKIVHLAAQHGDRVERGQELLFVEDLDTQLKVDQLAVRISSLNQKLTFLEEQLGRPLSAKERGDFLAERIRTQFELRKAKVERNLLVAEARSPRKSPVAAPLAGQVLTFDAKEKLLGKNVKVGDPLIRIASVEGAWEVELFVLERDAGLLRGALAQTPSAQLGVDLLLSSDPHRTYQGTISFDSLGGETTIRNDKVVVPARVTINDRDLLTQLDRMPVGVEVRARIHCGRASAGYVWFNEIWSFVYERFLF